MRLQQRTNGPTLRAARSDGEGRRLPGTRSPFPYLAAAQSEDPACPCPTPSASSHGDTTPQHKTHKTEDREVCYPWHPLFRQTIPIRLLQRCNGGVVAHCDDPTEVGSGGFEIPAWMLDRAHCSTMTLSQDPFVDTEALIQLRDVLDSARRKGGPDVVEDRHRLNTAQGGADAQAMPQTQATGVVSPPINDP